MPVYRGIRVARWLGCLAVAVACNAGDDDEPRPGGEAGAGAHGGETHGAAGSSAGLASSAGSSGSPDAPGGAAGEVGGGGSGEFGGKPGQGSGGAFERGGAAGALGVVAGAAGDLGGAAGAAGARSDGGTLSTGGTLSDGGTLPVAGGTGSGGSARGGTNSSGGVSSGGLSATGGSSTSSGGKSSSGGGSVSASGGNTVSSGGTSSGGSPGGTSGASSCEPGSWGAFSAPWLDVSDQPLFNELADVNDDGELDLIVATETTLEVGLGSGRGTFTALPTRTVSEYPETFLLEHLNDDAHLDVVIGSRSHTEVFLGAGDGSFTLPTRYERASSVSAIGDFDEDGVKDLVGPIWDATGSSLMLGRGDGTFRAGVPVSSLRTGAIAVADMDDDGHLDLVSTDWWSKTLSIQLGDGNGHFTDWVTLPEEDPGALLVADVDDDGLLDIVSSRPNQGKLTVRLASDHGAFLQPAVYDVFVRILRMKYVDVTGDGLKDLVAGRVLAGRGDGTFTLIELPTGLSGASVAVGDVNSDGALDITSVSSELNRVNVIDSLAYPFRSLSHVTSYSTFADLDNDGREDAVAVAPEHNLSVLLASRNGLGTAKEYPIERYLIEPAAGDLNLDGNTDIALSDANDGSLQLYFGDGSGAFPAPQRLPIRHYAAFMHVVDFVHDGRPDLVIGELYTHKLVVLAGQADGSLLDLGPVVSAGNGPGQGVTGDVNSDGIQDLVITNYGEPQISIVLGRVPSQPFSVQHFSTGAIAPLAVALQDLNHDGHLDIVASYLRSPGFLTMLGKGDGTFGIFRHYPVESDIWSFAVADFNQDGVGDVVVSSQFPHAMQPFFGSSTGQLTAGKVYDNAFGTALTASDINGDKVPDVLGFNSTFFSLINRCR